MRTLLTSLIRLAVALCTAWVPWSMSSHAQTAPQGTAATRLLVIVHNKVPVASLSPKQVADLYLGRARNWSDGQAVTALDNPTESPLRARFFKALTGKAITDINAYWARLLFTGQCSPPQPVADHATIVAMVRASPGAIGYVEASAVPNPEAAGVKVVLDLNAP